MVRPAILAGWASRDAAAPGGAGAGPTQQSQRINQPPWKIWLYSLPGASGGNFSLPDSLDPFLSSGSSVQASVFAAAEGIAAAGDVDENSLVALLSLYSNGSHAMGCHRGQMLLSAT